MRRRRSVSDAATRRRERRAASALAVGRARRPRQRTSTAPVTVTCSCHRRPDRLAATDQNRSGITAARAGSAADRRRQPVDDLPRLRAGVEPAGVDQRLAMRVAASSVARPRQPGSADASSTARRAAARSTRSATQARGQRQQAISAVPAHARQSAAGDRHAVRVELAPRAPARASSGARPPGPSPGRRRRGAARRRRSGCSRSADGRRRWPAARRRRSSSRWSAGTTICSASSPSWHGDGLHRVD